MNDINGLHIAVLAVSILIIILLLRFLLGTASEAASGRKSKKVIEEPPGKPCPLCRVPLKPGERVHSVLYPGKPDSLMEIFGCPYCEENGRGKPKNKRICPVCRKEMAADSVVIARVFEKPGKKHVHVLGCSSCYSGKTNINKKQA